MDDTSENLASESKVRRGMRRMIGIGKHTPQLERRTARGAILVLASRFAVKAIQFSRTIVVARLLFPHDVGLFALSAAVLGIADTLIQPGMAAAIIQKKAVNNRHLDTAWTATIVRSVLVGCIALVFAPLAGRFLGNPDIVPIMQLLALAIVISGFENIGAILLVRDVRFNRKILYDLSIIVSETVVTIIAAFVLHNVWALVIGSIANRIAVVVFSYLVHPYRPRLSFDLEAFGELFIFGKWVGVASIISFFVAQGDTLSVGKLLGPESVGFYALAFALALLPAVEIGRTIGAVLFPHLSRLEHSARGHAFITMMRGVLVISIPATVGLAIVGESVVRIVYGSAWLPMLVPFYVLLAYGGIRTISYLIEPLYQSMGRPRISTTSTAIQLIVMMTLMVPLTNMYGLLGTAFSVLFGAIFALMYMLIGIRSGKDVSLRALLGTVILPVTSACVMALCLYIFERLMPVITVSILLLEVIIGILSYAAALYVFDFLSGRAVWRSILWLKINL